MVVSAHVPKKSPLLRFSEQFTIYPKLQKIQNIKVGHLKNHAILGGSTSIRDLSYFKYTYNK